jgi:peptidyl-prolyl cis-trans isomerase B (cyclophilin B)
VEGRRRASARRSRAHCARMKAATAALAALLLLAGCGGSKHSAKGGCVDVSPPKPQQRHAAKPTQRLDPAKTYDVELQTNCGTFTIRLAVATSPAATASFAHLVRAKFFDGTIFHRIVPGFVVQGGDPTQQGTGGPGYTTVDRVPTSTRYTFGLVAMAKTQLEAPGTAGSQFFVVTGKDVGLPPDYAVLGHVVSGVDVVRRIAVLGDATTEQPTRVVEIEKATLDVH